MCAVTLLKPQYSVDYIYNNTHHLGLKGDDTHI